MKMRRIITSKRMKVKQKKRKKKRKVKKMAKIRCENNKMQKDEE